MNFIKRWLVKSIAAVRCSALLGVMVISATAISGKADDSIHPTAKNIQDCSICDILCRPCDDESLIRLPKFSKYVTISNPPQEAMLRLSFIQEHKFIFGNWVGFIPNRDWTAVRGNDLYAYHCFLNNPIRNCKWFVRNPYEDFNAIKHGWGLARILINNGHAKTALRGIWSKNGWGAKAYPGPLIKNKLVTHDSPLTTSNQHKDHPGEYAKYFNPGFPSFYKWLLAFSGAWCVGWGWISLRRNRHGDLAGYVFFAGIILFAWGLSGILPWIGAL